MGRLVPMGEMEVRRRFGKIHRKFVACACAAGIFLASQVQQMPHGPDSYKGKFLKRAGGPEH